MLRYARKLNVDVLFKEDRAAQLRLLTVTTMTIIFDSTVERDLERAKTLSIQSPFLGLKDIQLN